MSGKFNLSHPIFYGPVMMGDNNQMLINKFNSFLENKSIVYDDAEAIKGLIKDTQRAIVEDIHIENYEKVEATNALAQVADSLTKQGVTDKDRLTRYWRKFIELVKDSAAVLGFARSLGNMLGLSIS